MLRRRELMADRRELPSGYQRCKYLESNGNQYITTGISPFPNIGFEIAFSIVKLEYLHVYAMGADTSYKTLLNISWDVSIPYVGVRLSGYGDELDLNKYLGEIRHIKLYSNGTWISSIPNVVKSVRDYYTSNINTGLGNIDLFCVQRKGSHLYGGIIKVYDFKIFDKNETAILNFIPAIDKTGKPCMYDTVTKQPFYNRGTGEFGYELMDGTYVAPV